jgi:methylase of polypeptide subunit release factors
MTRLLTSADTSDQVTLDPINASFASPLRSRLKNSVDILLFNPPYVPTNIDEAEDAQSNPDIQGSWAGGTDGMQITGQLLQDVKVYASTLYERFKDLNTFYRVFCLQGDGFIL